MKPGSIRRAATALVVGSLSIAACGGDDDTASDTAADTAADTATDTAADTGPAGSQAPATTGGQPGTAAPSTDGGDGTTAPTGSEGEPAEECTADRVGGELTMGKVSEPRGLDPVRIPGTGNNGGNEIIPLYDTLVRYDAATDEFVPVVAESLEPNAEFTEWTLTLREGVTFGNGDPLTAEAVQASFARHQDPANRSTNYNESLAVTEMEVVDELTLVFRLDAPWPRFPSLLAHVAGMVTNPAVVEEMGEDFNTNAVGAGVGPYELERWVPGEELVLKAKQDWWGGPVCIEQLRFITIAGADAIYDAFENGDIQVAYMRDARVAADAAEDGVKQLITVQNTGSIFVLNHVNGPTADPVVRQALAAAIDPELISQRAFGGFALATTALIADESVHYDGLEGPQPDPAQAAELVVQAKASGWDGNIELLCQTTPEQTEVCLATKAMMDAAGMNTTIVQKDVNDQITQVLVDRNFQVAAWAQPVSDAAPSIRLSASNASDGSLNVGGYANPEMDAALAALRSAADEDAVKEALAEVQRIWNETIPSVVYQSTQETFLLADSLKGVQLSQNSQIHFDDAYIED